jgi:hypothetical protein
MKAFCFQPTGPTIHFLPRWSLNQNRSAFVLRHKIERSVMKIVHTLAIAGLFASLLSARAFTFNENFAHNPSADGWQTFGDTNLFQWNSTNQNLGVTWDSTHTNSYFFHPLDFAVTANDDFRI